MFNNSVLNFPRMPRSAIANDGTIANTKKRILIIQKQSTQNISTFKTCSSNIYCMTKTRYLKKERESSLNNNLAVNSSSTLIYFTILAAAGILSINLTNHDSRKKNKINSKDINEEIKSRVSIQKTESPMIGPECAF